MAQGVRSDPPGDVRCLSCGNDDAIELPCANRLQRILAREQPAVGQHQTLLPSRAATTRPLNPGCELVLALT